MALVDYFSKLSFECSNCEENFVEPAKNMCGHYVCLQCEINLKSSTCPTCKAAFVENFNEMVEAQGK